MGSKPVKINIDWCKACGLCIEVCPKDVFLWSKDIGKHGVKVPEIKKPSRCTKCMMCEMICPDFAITVEGTRKKKAKSPVESKPKKKKKTAAKKSATKAKPTKKPKVKPKKKAKKKPKPAKRGKKR